MSLISAIQRANRIFERYSVWFIEIMVINNWEEHEEGWVKCHAPLIKERNPIKEWIGKWEGDKVPTWSNSLGCTFTFSLQYRSSHVNTVRLIHFVFFSTLFQNYFCLLMSRHTCDHKLYQFMLRKSSALFIITFYQYLINLANEV